MSRFETIAYTDGDTGLKGLFAKPNGATRAAITIYPTFMNTTPGVEDKARRLVEQGYAVFIADFYGPSAPSNFDEAFSAMNDLSRDPVAMRTRLRASLDMMRGLTEGLPQLAIGYCLGGKAVLEMAREGQDLVAVASFHGLLDTSLPAEDTITARILVCHGDADAMVPRTQVMAFWEEMDAANADWHFHSYSGVDHGFTMPTRFDGEVNPAYNASAQRQSWNAMISLFDECLG
ncbi:dienelactone hydrolase family protein [Erythrobacter sp. SCSIO 43205]|uniref:dienelactone hydrolase family protein n=1 Tax=Erythrobacter sp. SCSIO 43205 TaxID=2779361 RepID=UPI001CA9B400|nr:dienelactone hydrolase family protein [Erythrobacter sp. SCSIO 43205]UAB77122.1 dienelactone hydrolase family protein [Erythrobacter sp. SCSIO 43205]